VRGSRSNAATRGEKSIDPKKETSARGGGKGDVEVEKRRHSR